MIIRQAKLFVALASLICCSIDCTATAFSDDRILDNDGNVVVKYVYDAWGVCDTIVLDDNASDIANLNPFRYRSYYLDTGLNLYYLKTRYYDPEICRFTTIDDLGCLRPDTINGVNLYAYCRNNPIKYCDPSGYIAPLFGIEMEEFKCLKVVILVLNLHFKSISIPHRD